MNQQDLNALTEAWHSDTNWLNEKIDDYFKAAQDHAYALGLARGLKEAEAKHAATKAEAKPLTQEQIIGLLYPIYDGLPSLTPITDTKVARATEAACAEAWGVKLAGIGASSGGAA